MKIYKKIFSITLIVALILMGINVKGLNSMAAESTITKGIKDTDFIKTNGKDLKNNYGYGETIYLRGTNAGGLALQEFWMCPTESTDNVKDQSDIWAKLTERFGEDAARTLITTYEKNYWTESDFDKCASLGMNCIRLPLWYRNFVDSNNNWYEDAFEWVDWFVQEAGERGMYVIIDMHGAYGSQNGSDHSGVDGGDDKLGASEFFFGDNVEDNQEKYYQMWEKLAEHFKGNPVVAGYDLLNEPFCTYRYTSGYSANYLRSLLWEVYDEAYQRIRAIDEDHVIIMEAVWNSEDLPNPNTYGWTNVMYEYHQYEYSDYNNASGTQISSMQTKIDNVLGANYNVPSYIGEFCYFNNYDAWDEGLGLLNNNGLHWTSWTYKCVSEYGNWGLMNQSVDKVNVETDSYNTILDKWSKVGNSSDNRKLQNVYKEYTPGVIAHAQDSATTTVIEEGEYYIACDNNIVTAKNSGDGPLVANKEAYSGASESFILIDNEDGTISLQSKVNEKYVQANVGDGGQLIASGETVGDWEKFYLVHITDNQYALISYANGKYVKADFDDATTGLMKATSVSIGGAWEAFSFYKFDENGEPPTTETPTITPTAPIAVGRHEAENADSFTQGGASNPHNIQSNSAFSNGQAIGNMNAWPNDGRAYCTTTVFAYTAGTYTLTIGYAGGVAEEYPSMINARINNGEWVEMTAPATAGWNTVKTISTEVELVQGENVIDITGAVLVWYGSWDYNQWVNIDYFELSQKETDTEPPTTEPSAGEIVVSDKIKVEGYQISYVNGGSRVVGSVEDTINGKKVASWGYIYGLANANGVSYDITPDDIVLDSDSMYIMSYESTLQGTVDTIYGESTTATYFVRTMKFVGQVSYEYTAEYYVRAYAVLEDGSYVYSEVEDYTIYEIADDLYTGRKMNNNAGHEYLYDNILTRVNPAYEKLDYAWNNTIVKL